MRLSSLLAVAALTVACGQPDTLYDDGNQGAASCPIPATFQGQPGVSGDPCSSAAADCSPACCECPSGTDSYWASECIDGACAPDSEACNDAPSASLCQ
jgi:hypothetical protein